MRKLLLLVWIAAAGLLLLALGLTGMLPVIQTWDLTGPGDPANQPASDAWYAGAGAAGFLAACFVLFLLAALVLLRRNRGGMNPQRRDTLLGLLVGLPVAALLPTFLQRKHYRTPILPPGAQSVEDCAEKCTRCYECVRACPSGIIGVRKAGALPELLMPEIVFLDDSPADRPSQCQPDCNACSQSCPTGALVPLELPQKRQRQIGLAVVRKEHCLGWHDHQACMVCQYACPYQAIEESEMRAGGEVIPCPVVNPDRCRGCNACVLACVAETKALHVVAVARQRQLPEKS